jgi:hypothetical protein
MSTHPWLAFLRTLGRIATSPATVPDIRVSEELPVDLTVTSQLSGRVVYMIPIGGSCLEACESD